MGIIKKGIVSGVCFLVPLISYADNLYLPDFHETVAKFYASGSSNTAFLTEYPLKRVSYLQAFAVISNGDFVNFNQSDNAYRVGMKTESYFRLNDRIMLYGMRSYGMDRGKNMSGSAFIAPDEAPFDLVEMTDTCAGSKRLEAYKLSGGVAYQLNSKVSLGGKIFYQTSNYAKFKDLRHQNSRMDLSVDLGATYTPWSWITFGLSYTYNRQNESVGFGVYGNTDRQYYTLINYGGFIGRKEAFGESGYTSDTTPLFTQSHGGGVQLLFNLNDNMKWFNEFRYSNADGRFGTGDDRDIIYSTHEVKTLNYQSKFIYQQNKDTHAVELAFNKISTTNFENNYKESTDENGVSQIVYYGKNEMLDRSVLNGTVSYTFYRNSDQVNRSKFFMGARFSFSSRDGKTSVFPFYRKQKINQWSAEWFGTHNWFKNKQVFTLSLLAGYGAGGGTMKDDGTYIEVSDKQKRPANRNDLLEQEYDYLTASRIYGKLSAGYERYILKNVSGYVTAGISPKYALNSTLKEKSYLQFDIQIGVKF